MNYERLFLKTLSERGWRERGGFSAENTDEGLKKPVFRNSKSKESFAMGSMKLSDTISLAVQNIFSNKMRSLLTMLGVGVGMGAIIFLVGIGLGLQRLTIERLTSSATVTTLDVSSNNPDLLKIDKNALDRIKNFPEVETVSATTNLPGQITLDDLTSEALIRVVDDEYYSLSGLKFVSGKKIGAAGEAVITTSLLKVYSSDNQNFDKFLGKKVKLTIFNLQNNQASGEQTIELEAEISGAYASETQIIEISRLNAEKLAINEFSKIKVKVKDSKDVGAIQVKITDLGFDVASLLDKINEINRVFKIIQATLAGFGLIALLVASIGMFNTMTVSLLERTRDIGIMRAIGARRSEVKKLFIFEAGAMGFLGGLIGILLSGALSVLVNAGVNILARSAGQENVSIYYLPPLFLALILTFSLIVGLSTGIYPAFRAAKINPLNALKYE